MINLDKLEFFLSLFWIKVVGGGGWLASYQFFPRTFYKRRN